MSTPLFVTFLGGDGGSWTVERFDVVRGETMPEVGAIEIVEGTIAHIAGDWAWALRGVTSNERYVTRAEHSLLAAQQAPLARADATRGALIPIRKSATWWDLSQDERRSIFEERSHHVRVGLEYLPAIARRLHHARDLGEPFDFLTWFEYAPAHTQAFEELVEQLRATEEWSYVEREIDIRLTRAPSST